MIGLITYLRGHANPTKTEKKKQKTKGLSFPVKKLLDNEFQFRNE